MDDELHAKVKAAATEDRRSMNGELLRLLDLGLRTRAEQP